MLTSAAGFGRVVQQPKKRGKHVVMRTCDGDGELQERVIAKSQGKDWYRSARKSNLGDLFETPVVEEDEERPLTKTQRILIEGKQSRAERRRRRLKREQERREFEEAMAGEPPEE
jgi:ribosomal protein RSM22 (predicted rRNA methylase)